MKKIFSILLVLSLLFTSTFVYGNTAQLEDLNVDVSGEQKNSSLFYNEMITEFVNIYGEENGYPKQYPNYYGGSYIAENNKLIVNITDSSKEYEKELALLFNKILNKVNSQISEKISLEDVIALDYVDHSLNGLYDELNSFKEITYSGKNVYGGYVDEINNSLVVTFDSSDATISRMSLNNKLNSDDNRISVSFDPVIPEIPTANHISGQGPYIHGSSGGVTLGFPGTYNGKLAYVTCGHLSNAPLGSAAKYNGVTIGTVVAKRWANNTSGDWAIITLNSTERVTGIIKKNASGSSAGKISARLNYVAPGSIVYRFGYKSATWSSHKVEAVNISWPWIDVASGGTYTINGQVKTSKVSGVHSVGGDSGGPFVLSQGNNNWAAVGTLTGYHSSGFDFYSPMGLVPSGFTVDIGYDGDLP